jgi:selenocysteine lyase/cysteine desulfurase
LLVAARPPSAHARPRDRAAMAGRQHFAALRAPPTGEAAWAFLENAGGSLLPDQAVASASHYMQTSFVQLGAGYAASEAAGETVASARRLVHALASPSPDSGFCVLGASSSSLFHVVSLAVEPSIVREGTHIGFM